MENKKPEEKPTSPYLLPLAVVVAGVLISGAMLYEGRFPTGQTVALNGQNGQNGQIQNAESLSALESAVLPPDGVVLPVTWGDLGARLVSVGAIDGDKFAEMYDQRGEFTPEYQELLFGDRKGQLKITKDNAGYLLNLFWALGLANKNPILDTGEMVNPRYGGAKNFASTAGWTMAKGDSMEHFSRHMFFNLTPEQQALVEKVSKGIFRPCCGNSTYFPDCNHGMAMLGLLELMASQGASEQDMWKTALTVNSYWFPETYLVIASYMMDKGTEWKDVNPQEMLGSDYSSGAGFARISSQVAGLKRQGNGGGCAVDAGQQRGGNDGNGCAVNTGQPAVAKPKPKSGCGV